MRKRGR
jgi:hypothetical protein